MHGHVMRASAVASQPSVSQLALLLQMACQTAQTTDEFAHGALLCGSAGCLESPTHAPARILQLHSLVSSRVSLCDIEASRTSFQLQKAEKCLKQKRACVRLEQRMIIRLSQRRRMHIF